MNYYDHNIGDFAILTQGLDLEGVGIVIRMIDRMMSTEKPIRTQWVNLAFPKETQEKAKCILESLFEEVEGGWIQPELMEKIDQYQRNVQKNRENGKKGGRPRKTETQKKPIGFSDETQPKANETLTNNQEPITNNHREEKVEKEIPTLAVEVEKPKRSRKKPVTSCPFSADEAIPEAFHTYAAEKHSNLNAQEEFSKFVNFHLSKGSQFADWLAAFRTWMTNAEKFAANDRYSSATQKRKTTPGFGVQLEQDPCDPSTWDQQAIEEVFRRSEAQLDLANLDDTGVPF